MEYTQVKVNISEDVHRLEFWRRRSDWFDLYILSPGRTEIWSGGVNPQYLGEAGILLLQTEIFTIKTKMVILVINFLYF